MEFLAALFVTGIIQVGGLLVLARYHQRALDKQNETIKTLALFKKARDPADMHLLNMVTGGNDNPETKQDVKQDERRNDADDLSDEAIAKIRSQMSPDSPQ